MRGLILQGGGAKGGYEAGAIKALNKRGIYFDIVGGTSIGAINAAMYVTKDFNKMYKLWSSATSQELFGIETELIKRLDKGKRQNGDIRNFIKTLGSILKNGGIDIKNIKSFLEKNISEKKFMRSNIDYYMNTFSLKDFKRVDVFKKDIKEGKLIEYVLSSAYLPFFKFEKIIDDSYYLDGGIVTNCPIDALIDHGCDEVYVIKAWQSKVKYKNSRNAKVRIIEPRENLGSIMLFDKEVSEYRMDLGYYDTIKYLDNLDGHKYYFKHYSDEYYTGLFDKNTFKRMVKKYNNSIPPRSNKYFIIKMIERICMDLKIKRFRVYNLPYLLTRLKYVTSGKKDYKYYDFIKNIKVDFE